MTVMIAKSRRPTAVPRSQLPSSAATVAASTPLSSAASCGFAIPGTAAARFRGAIPATNRNRSSDRSGLSNAFIDPMLRSRAWANTNAVTSAAARPSRWSRSPSA